MKIIMTALVPSSRVADAVRGIRAMIMQGTGVEEIVGWHARIENDIGVSWNPDTAPTCPLCELQSISNRVKTALYIATGLPAEEKAKVSDAVKRLCGFNSAWFSERFQGSVPELDGMILEQRTVLDQAVMDDASVFWGSAVPSTSQYVVLRRALRGRMMHTAMLSGQLEPVTDFHNFRWILTETDVRSLGKHLFCSNRIR